MPQIIEAMAELKRKGWPSAFVFAYKQPWLVIERLFDFAASVMGTEDLAIEPSVFAWLLDPPSGNVERAGNNGFHLPHRDFSFTETFDDCGALKALSIWVPLSDVDARNGCMFVLPKEFDATHDKPQHPNHLSPLFYLFPSFIFFVNPLSNCHSEDNTKWRAKFKSICRRAATVGREGSLELNFPLQGIRPLEAPAGAVLGWHGNSIHWYRARERERARGGV